MLSTLRCGYSVKSLMYALDEYGRLCLALYPFFFVGTGMEGGGTEGASIFSCIGGFFNLAKLASREL